MLSLSPAKILVILVVALLVLGPDKLPDVARQIGAFWHDLRGLRGRLESGVRDAFPDLPSPQQVAQAVRSPLAYLDDLADRHAAGLQAAGTADGEPGSGGEVAANGSEVAANGNAADGSGSEAAPTAAAGSGSADADDTAAGPPARPTAPDAGQSTAGWADGLGELADDPSMN